jgi:DNA-binding transcriptional MocR family regulator
VSHIQQRILLEVLSDGATTQLLERAKRTYASRRLALIAALASHGIDAFGRSGINVWVPVPEELRVVRALLDDGWAVAAGERFRLRSAPGVRITVSTLEPTEAKAVAACIAQSLAETGRTYAG